MTAPTVETSSSIPPAKEDPSSSMDDPPQRKGVIGWVKGKIQKRNIAAKMGDINLDEIEKAAVTAEGGEPSELDIAMGLGEGGVVLDPKDEIPEEDRIDLEAENDEGLLVGWGKKLQEVEWVQKTVQVVQERQEDAAKQQELREIHEKYKDEIKADPDIKALQKKIKKITKNLKIQRLNGDRINKRHTFQRDKEQKELDAKTARLRKAIWTFSNSSMNSHEYAKAMMRASARLQRKGIKVHKSEKALAMEAAVLRNMHRMLAIQKQYGMAKRHTNDVSGFMKRCKGWLDNKLADGEMGIMVLEATAKSMELMYAETVEVQEALIPKFTNPKDHTFGKQRMKTVLALPKGLRSMPMFLKGPKQPPMRISLRKKQTDEDPNLQGYRTFKEKNRAMEIAWKQELKEYENQLLVGGDDFKIYKDEDVSDLGDSEDEIEENLAAVSMGAAAAKKASVKFDVPPKIEDPDPTEKEGEEDKVTEDKKEEEKKAAVADEKEEEKNFADDKAKAAEEGEAAKKDDKAEEEEEEAKVEDKEKPAEETEKPTEKEEEKPTEEEEKPAKMEEKEEEPIQDDDDTAGETLATGGGDPLAPTPTPTTDAATDAADDDAAEVAAIDKSERSAAEESTPTVPEETPQEQQKADAAALEEAQKSGDENEEDPEVDETALPQEVKQEDLDDLLDKEVDAAAAQADVSDHADNDVEEALAGVVEDTLAAVGNEEGVEEEPSEEEEEAPDPRQSVAASAATDGTDVSV